MADIVADARMALARRQNGGYASYVVPAAFLLIIQQTLLMGSATLGGVANEKGGMAARCRRDGFRAVIGQSLAHLCLMLPTKSDAAAPRFH